MNSRREVEETEELIIRRYKSEVTHRDIEESPNTSKRLRTRSLTDSDYEILLAADSFDCSIVSKETVVVVESTVFQENKRTIEDLPDEILQTIFCRIPLVDMISSCGLVCRRFQKIIADPTFLIWEKLYFRYVSQLSNAITAVQINVIEKIDVDRGQYLLSNTVEFLSGVLKLTAAERTEALGRLQKHKLYELVKKKLQYLNLQGHWNSPGALIAMMVLFSDSVSLILELVHLMTWQPSLIHMKAWMEYFYCFATVLLASSKKLWLDERRHYQLHYALYLFSNSGGVSVNSGDKILTYEQIRIVKYQLQPLDCVQITAFAGTGKTTTLVEFCKARPKQRFLVILYNRAISDDAKQRFPSNAFCSTIHKLAYEFIKGKYVRKNLNWRGATTEASPGQLSQILNVCRPDIKGVGRYQRAAIIRQTLVNFYASSDEHITSAHVPTEWPNGDGLRNQIGQDLRIALAKQCVDFWKASINDDDTTITMQPDCFLKLYQLSQPRFTGYDAVLIDESQDCTPAVLDIIRNQSIPKILVGDRYQKIYGFRGAVADLSEIETTKRFYLTQSFRFGAEIGYIVNAWMRKILHEKNKFLIGNDSSSRVDQISEGQVAIICRTNLGVFGECANVAATETNASIYINNGTKSFDFTNLEAIYCAYLRDSGKKYDASNVANHWILRSGKSMTDVKAQAVASGNTDMISKISIVESYKEDIMTLIKLIKSRMVEYMSQAKYIITTVHQAKGLEFANVRLANDFVNLEGLDETNLLYVAMTRAKESLTINETILRTLLRQQPSFMQSLSVFTKKEVCTGCDLLSAESPTVFLEQKPILMAFVPQTTAYKPANLYRLNIHRHCKNCVRYWATETEAAYNLTFTSLDGSYVKTFRTECGPNYKYFLPLLSKVG